MLTAEQLKAREGKFTATMAKVVMTGTDAELLSLWKQMLGMEEPPSLDSVWPVRLGEATERLNLDWYSRKYGRISRMGEVAINPDIPWAAATLDAWDHDRACPVEAKHVGGREAFSKIIERYTPQCTWQMIVTGAKECALSVIMGANEPIVEFVEFDAEYGAELMRRARAFMQCVESLTPPVVLPKVEPPPPPTKSYDMTESNVWGNYATVWLRAKGEAEQFEMATKELKAHVPQDAQKAFGHGVIATRNRAGAIRIQEAYTEVKAKYDTKGNPL